VSRRTRRRRCELALPRESSQTFDDERVTCMARRICLCAYLACASNRCILTVQDMIRKQFFVFFREIHTWRARVHGSVVRCRGDGGGGGGHWRLLLCLPPFVLRPMGCVCNSRIVSDGAQSYNCTQHRGFRLLPRVMGVASPRRATARPALVTTAHRRMHLWACMVLSR
jgi:hypothetical protein